MKMISGFIERITRREHAINEEGIGKMETKKVTCKWNREPTFLGQLWGKIPCRIWYLQDFETFRSLSFLRALNVVAASLLLASFVLAALLSYSNWKRQEGQSHLTNRLVLMDERTGLGLILRGQAWARITICGCGEPWSPNFWKYSVYNRKY